MRVGLNPNKDKHTKSGGFFHQVIIPVYIPNNEGYFKDSFQILKYCMESLFSTIHPKTFVTAVNNGSCIEVVDYLNELHQRGKIQEVIHTSNIGKINAVIKGISGHDFSFITVSDCDVLFLDNWQVETYKVFDAFPKTGAVCPTPSSRSLKNHTSNIWFDLFFSKSLFFSKVKNPKALKAFAASIENPDFYNEIHLEKYLTVSNKNIRAVVGAGHFIATYRKEVFEKNNIKYSNFMLGGKSVSKFLDVPVVRKGMWRLSTEDNFAYHLGNVGEKWMSDTLEQIGPNNFFPESPIVLKKNRFSKIRYFFETKLFFRIITRKKIWYYCLIFKGLSKKEATSYIQK
ncbi:glycosyltransferase family A protein [Flavobacterium quisquiliarum]|uniref:Glycosyltransferase family A protein n=1 Tax=Flavobacterium quisquiliarum TaxID=1834436 RepID=A0ABV8WE96_9FLAO|nr:glycosyltransferase family A protein [Flavobacterium quisquiliarum]MBW1657720.1 glycosyltransferase [Flavobacterium quisquiliarum]NWL04059.1 glycosyltransferase family 2 protein [Flavobacterium collinsii]